MGSGVLSVSSDTPAPISTPTKGDTLPFKMAIFSPSHSEASLLVPQAG